MSTTTLSSSAASASALVGNSKDLVGEILSRLPLSSVMRFRLVCKEWCSLTSTQSFIDMHENINNTSCFVVQYFNESQIYDYWMTKSDHFNTLLFNLDDNNNDTKVKMKVVREYIRGRGETNFFHIKRYYDIKLISSYRGFLLFTAKPADPSMSMSARFRRWLTTVQEEEDPALIFLYNPVTKEQYTVAAPPTTHVYCGFYYHSPTKEYRILYQLIEFPKFMAGTGGVVQFLVLGLKTQDMRVLKLQEEEVTTDHDYYSNKKIPTSRRPDAAAYYYHPDPSTPPVISNGSLHWIVSELDHHGHLINPPQIPNCSHTILSFGMESEEFHTRPHPPLSHACSQSGPKHYRHCMNLLEMDGGILCLCDGYYSSRDLNSKPILEIYVMEDYKKWTWVRRYRVDLSKYIHYGCQYGLSYKALQILQGDQLLLHYYPDTGYPNISMRHKLCNDPHEYALYSLNQHEDGQLRPALVSASSSSSSTGMVRKSITKKKNKRQPFQVLIDGSPGDELLGRLRRMIINSKKKKKPPKVKGNMVVLTPSLASLQHKCTTNAVGISKLR